MNELRYDEKNAGNNKHSKTPKCLDVKDFFGYLIDEEDANCNDENDSCDLETAKLKDDDKFLKSKNQEAPQVSNFFTQAVNKY